MHKNSSRDYLASAAITLRNENYEAYGIIAGAFLIVGLTEGDSASLSDEHIKQFYEDFKPSEIFINCNDMPMILLSESKVTVAAKL